MLPHAPPCSHHPHHSSKVQCDAEIEVAKAALDAAVLRRTRQLGNAVTRLNRARAHLDDIETVAEAFKDKVAGTPLEGLSTDDACQLLQLLGASDLQRSLLEREQVTGASLAFMTEADMKTVFGIQQLGCANLALDCGLFCPK